MLCVSLARSQSTRRLGEDTRASTVRHRNPLSILLSALTTLPNLSSYLYRICIGADGNHTLHKKSKRDDKTDYSLSDGRAFFAESSKMAAFAKAKGKEGRTVVRLLFFSHSIKINVLKIVHQVRTCSGFKVTRSQRAGKFRNMDISGVVAILCLRHGCFFPRAIVDLVGNEQYVWIPHEVMKC